MYWSLTNARVFGLTLERRAELEGFFFLLAARINI